MVHTSKKKFTYKEFIKFHINYMKCAGVALIIPFLALILLNIFNADMNIKACLVVAGSYTFSTIFVYIYMLFLLINDEIS